MSTSSPAVAVAVLSTGESRFAVSNHDSSFFQIGSLIAAIDAVKPSAALAEFAGIGIRAAQLVLEGRNGLSGESVVNLLRSRIGDRVLDFLLGDPAPVWRAAERRLMGVAELERELEQLEQKRRHLLSELAAREQGRR